VRSIPRCLPLGLDKILKVQCVLVEVENILTNAQQLLIQAAYSK